MVAVKESAPKTTPDSRREDPFAATPVVAPDVEVRKDNCELVQLRRPVPPKTPLGSALNRWFNYQRTIRINLDERGTDFWDLIDGTRDLHAIERKLRSRYGLKSDESKYATIEFTKTLMTRGLICLQVPGSHEE